MNRILRLFVMLLVVNAIVGCTAMFTKGDRVVPTGYGTVTIDSNTFEDFPLPVYIRDYVTDDYKSYFIEVEPGIKVHMLEVGSGLPVYLQHGNPTSGLLYRKVVNELPKDRFRLIMPTLVGLGHSTKVPASEHTMENHVRWISGALKRLDLKDVVFVGQDWGGPIGMGALARSPELLKGAVIMNTGFTAPKEAIDISLLHALVKTPLLGEIMIEGIAPMFNNLKNVQGDPDSFPDDVADLYGRPLRMSGNRKAGLALMRMVTDGPDHPSIPELQKVETYVKSLDIHTELVWGMNDPILAKALPSVQGIFPDAPLTKTEAGHFLQEEVPEEIAAAIVRVADKIQTSQHQMTAN